MPAFCFCIIDLNPQCSDIDYMLIYFCSSQFLHSHLWVTLNTRVCHHIIWFFFWVLFMNLSLQYHYKKATAIRYSQSIVCLQGKVQVFGGKLPRNLLAKRDKPSHSETPVYLVFKVILWTPPVVCVFQLSNTRNV